MTLPIVERELRVASRQRRTYYERFAWGIIAIVIMLYIMLDWRWGSQAQQGRNIFFTLSGFAFAYTIFSGIILSADSVSEEKREGTLGLLFLTNLKGYDVVFGKLAAHSLHGIYGLITIFPILAITFLMGGVPWSDLVRMVLLLMNTLFFSLALGTLVSTVSRVENRARLIVFLILFLDIVALPAIGSAWRDRLSPETVVLLYSLNPIYGWTQGFGNRGIQNLTDFWRNLVVIHGMAWLSLIAASYLASRVWKDKVGSFATTPLRLRLKQWRLGNRQEQNEYRTSLLSINPMTWLVNRNRLSKWYPSIFVASCVGLYGFGILKWGGEMFEEPVIIMFGITMHTIFKIWIISESVRQFTESKKSGALDLIISTPMTVSEIVTGYWGGLVYQFRWGVLGLLVADLALILCCDNYDDTWIITCGVGMLLFLVDAMTLGWLGMWLSLTRKSINAMLSCVFYIMALPWLIMFVFMVGGTHLLSGPNSALVVFLVISISIDYVFYQWSSDSLYREFRNQVANQFQGTRPKT